MPTRQYECDFMDVISDCDWNPRYNMFAVSGFGQEFPILVYVYERATKEIEEMFFRHGKLTSQTEVKPDLDDPQNADLLNNIANAQENLERSQNNRKSVMSEKARPRNNSFGGQSDYNISQSGASRGPGQQPKYNNEDQRQPYNAG